MPLHLSLRPGIVDEGIGFWLHAFREYIQVVLLSLCNVLEAGDFLAELVLVWVSHFLGVEAQSVSLSYE